MFSTDTYLTYHGLKLSNGSTIVNMEVESLAADPNPIRVGRIWHDSLTSRFKYSSLNADNTINIYSVANLDDIPSSVITENDNPNNQYFTLPSNINYDTAIALLTDEINTLYSKLTKSRSTQYYYTTDSTDIIPLEIMANNLIVVINGLEESENSYQIIENKIVFNSLLPPDSVIKLISFA